MADKVSKWIPTTDLMMLRRMGKLVEELGELQAVAARCIIQGIDEVDPGTGKVNRERLANEIADVYAQLDETVDRLGLDTEAILQRTYTKRGYMREWEEMFENANEPPPAATEEAKDAARFRWLIATDRVCRPPLVCISIGEDEEPRFSFGPLVVEAIDAAMGGEGD